MANGEAVPNGIVNDVIAEAMVKSAAGSDVIVLSYRSFMKQLYKLFTMYKKFILIGSIILQGFLIDGYPSDEAQANEFVNDIGPPTAVICLEIPDEVAVGRLSSRGNFDDDASAIEKRLKVWNEKTKPVAEKHKAFVINADRSANEIVADVEKAIN